MPIKPPPLRKGDRIGIMSPSSRVTRASLAPGVALLRARGYDVYVHPQTYDRRKSSAGTEAAKADALHDLFADDSIRAIIAAGGGNHGLFLLPHLDDRLIRRNPKIVMGFSDATSLINAIHARTGLVTFHGPVAKWLGHIAAVDQTLSLLSGRKMPAPMGRARIVAPGTAEGPLIGGNLTLLNYLAGTRFMPDPRGAILVIEDLNEERSNIDRMLWRLRAVGVLDKISGLVVGQFTDLKDSGKTPYGLTLRDMIERNTADLGIPVVMNAPFGHTRQFTSFAVGARARLTARGATITLRPIESPTS